MNQATCAKATLSETPYADFEIRILPAVKPRVYYESIYV